MLGWRAHLRVRALYTAPALLRSTCCSPAALCTVVRARSLSVRIANRRRVERFVATRYYLPTRLRTAAPDVACEWDYAKNPLHLYPEVVSVGYVEPVWWRCRACEHGYKMSVEKRVVRGGACPRCAANATTTTTSAATTATPSTRTSLAGVVYALTVVRAMFSYQVEDECARHAITLLESRRVCMRVGHVRLLRNMECKGKFFAPFIPTTQLLLLFPACANPAQRDALAEEAVGKMSAYLRHLLNASGVQCRIEDAALCTFSGCALLLLHCSSVTSALHLLGVWGDTDAQDETMRMCALYIQCYPCHVELASAHGGDADCVDCAAGVSVVQPPASPASPSLLAEYYYIPTCVVCADRLETVLTGQVAESALCTCAASRRRCACLRRSLCRVCEMFVRAQEVHVATPQPVKCQACGQSGDPWVCMVCGFVGCSRYQAMHAKEHCICHAHFFSMNLLTQQIWDYHSDAFVHRVLLNVNAGAGLAARVQFPGRDNPLVEGMDDDDDDSGGGTASTTASVDCGVYKKCVSAKYDAKLSTSHTQYALLLKNELDTMRATLASVPLSHISASGAQGMAGTLPNMRAGAAQRRPAAARKAATAPAHTSCDVYATMRSLDDVVRTRAHVQRQVATLCCGVRNLSDELRLSTQQGDELAAQERALQSQLRAIVTRNAAEELKVQSSIAELEATLREIELNVQTQRRVVQQLGERSGDDAVVMRVAIAGTGHASPRGGAADKAARGRRGRATR